ncbi:MAG TPA: iron-containing alcohol dehydrogenase [Candidatus Dormibacteraeota bacterium]|nr:iron-containing alcohol dehydrogenase [Candidatus Dormibacteraeota bacterium]
MTNVFRYANPLNIYWGPGSVAQLGPELQRLEAPRVALVTTRSLLGSLDVLGFEPVATVVVGQHAPNAQIGAGAHDVGRARARAIVSFGGGSVIDAAKIISVKLAGEDGRALPHVAVPTTLSAAELAAGAGYTNDAGDKAGMRDPRLLVETVIYDAGLTLQTPMELWLSTGIRALDHAVEGFLSEGQHPFNDLMALSAVRLLFDSLPRAKASPEDVSVRTENQLAAWFSFTLPGASAAGLSHTMGKQIGARHGIPHGVTSCLLLPHVMRYLARSMPERMQLLAQATGADPADRVEVLIAALKLPQHVREFDVGEAALRRAADELAGKYPAADLLGIYLAAL